MHEQQDSCPSLTFLNNPQMLDKMTLAANYMIRNGANNPIRALIGNDFAALCLNHIFKGGLRGCSLINISKIKSF